MANVRSNNPNSRTRNLAIASVMANAGRCACARRPCKDERNSGLYSSTSCVMEPLESKRQSHHQSAGRLHCSAVRPARRVVRSAREACSRLAAGMTTRPAGHELAACALLARLARLHQVRSCVAYLEALDHGVLEPGRQQLLDVVQQRSLVGGHE